jgi:hypothetical protein
MFLELDSIVGFAACRYELGVGQIRQLTGRRIETVNKQNVSLQA